MLGCRIWEIMMGTRADFYVGKNRSAEWIGSIAMDGYRDGIDDTVLGAISEGEFRSAVQRPFEGRGDVTLPSNGWPWLWPTSKVTDCSYWFFQGAVWDEQNGQYALCSPEVIEFPEFDTSKSAQAGSSRAGNIVVSVQEPNP